MRRLLSKCLKFNSSGVGLVETLISVTVGVIVVVAMISLIQFSFRNSRQASYASYATQLAQTQLELVRAYRDNGVTSWASFTSLTSASSNPNCTSSCYFAPGSSGSSAPSQGSYTSSPYTYFFTLTCTSGAGTCDSSSGTVRAHVQVTWNVGGKTQTIYNDTDFTNWRAK